MRKSTLNWPHQKLLESIGSSNALPCLFLICEDIGVTISHQGQWVAKIAGCRTKGTIGKPEATNMLHLSISASKHDGLWRIWTVTSLISPMYIKAVYCHPAYSTYMQSTSRVMPGWMKHKLESRLLREISITSDTQMTPPLWQKLKN